MVRRTTRCWTTMRWVQGRGAVRARRSVVALLVAVGAAWAETPPAPLTQLPYTPSLDLASLDRTVDPCTDFYRYSCGGWLANNPLPPDRSRFSVYGKLFQENLQYLWGLLEQAARVDAQRTPLETQIGDYFAACIDQPARDAKGASPLQPALEALARVDSSAGLVEWWAARHREGTGLLFGFFAQQDPADARRVIATLDAGGLGLPNRDYYLATEGEAAELRAAYQRHVERMLTLIDVPAAEAASDARAVLRIETALARAGLSEVERRDPHRLHNPTTRERLVSRHPRLDWNRFFTGVGAPDFQQLNVLEPKFFAALERQLRTVPPADWKAYLRWHLLAAAAPELSEPLVQADFEFYGQTLRGQKARAPRWRTCVESVDQLLGEALGRVFVERTFPPEAKAGAQAMSRFVVQAMAARLDQLDWMGDATRQAAHTKLQALRTKIGYPDRWRDLSGIEVRRDDHYGNTQRAARFEAARDLRKIGQPVDRDEWEMSAPTVNAYYQPLLNDMNFPAGVLLPPLYDLKLDDAPNYGNTGSTIGHELTHGFDDEGRQYDANGNLRDWWTKRDARAFRQRAECLVKQYGAYPIVDQLTINSRLTLGEDLADLGGTILAYEAWRLATQTQRLAPVDGFTPDQRFFIGFAQWACEQETLESMRVNAKTNPHSPGRYRINGVVVNMPEFAAAFGCREGQPMVKPEAERCRVW